MKIKMKIYKFFLILGLVVLFVGVSIVPSGLSGETQETPAGRIIQSTWIVDNEGDGDFITIMGAIGNALVLPDDILEVYSGTYSENVVVDKQLILRGIDNEYGSGSDTGKPVIESPIYDDVVTVVVDSVIIEGFEITLGLAGIYLDSTSNHFIRDNILSENNVGIWLFDSNNNEITDNTLSLNFEVGIYLDDSDTNLIEGNWVEDSQLVGIWVLDLSVDNRIYNNYFDNVENAWDDGANNVWNIAPTLGGNIIGGFLLGGNWWSDFPHFGPPFPNFDPNGLGLAFPPWDYPITGSAGAVDSHPIPGFELIVVIAALAISLIILKRKK